MNNSVCFCAHNSQLDTQMALIYLKLTVGITLVFNSLWSKIANQNRNEVVVLRFKLLKKHLVVRMFSAVFWSVYTEYASKKLRGQIRETEIKFLSSAITHIHNKWCQIHYHRWYDTRKFLTTKISDIYGSNCNKGLPQIDSLL